MSTPKETENMSIYSIRTMDVEPDLIEKMHLALPIFLAMSPFRLISRLEMSAGEPHLPQNRPIRHFSGLSTRLRLAQVPMVRFGWLRTKWSSGPWRSNSSSNKITLYSIMSKSRFGARVAHPGTPTIYDIGLDEDGQFRVIMEYMEGESSSAKIIERLRSGDPQAHEEYPFHVRAEMVTCLLRVLVAAHQKQIVHCDIKPENVLVGASKEVYLCD